MELTQNSQLFLNSQLNKFYSHLVFIMMVLAANIVERHDLSNKACQGQIYRGGKEACVPPSSFLLILYYYFKQHEKFIQLF